MSDNDPGVDPIGCGCGLLLLLAARGRIRYDRLTRAGAAAAEIAKTKYQQE